MPEAHMAGAHTHGAPTHFCYILISNSTCHIYVHEDETSRDDLIMHRLIFCINMKLHSVRVCRWFTGKNVKYLSSTSGKVFSTKQS